MIPFEHPKLHLFNDACQIFQQLFTTVVSKGGGSFFSCFLNTLSPPPPGEGRTALAPAPHKPIYLSPKKGTSFAPEPRFASSCVRFFFVRPCPFLFMAQEALAPTHPQPMVVCYFTCADICHTSGTAGGGCHLRTVGAVVPQRANHRAGHLHPEATGRLLQQRQDGAPPPPPAAQEAARRHRGDSNTFFIFLFFQFSTKFVVFLRFFF